MHRSWFPAILLGLSLLLGAGFMAAVKARHGESFFKSSPPAEETVSVTEDGYEAAVNGVLAEYQKNHNAETAYNALVALRVPTADLSLHLDLVIAMSKIMAGQKDDGAGRLNALKAQYSWLAL